MSELIANFNVTLFLFTMILVTACKGIVFKEVGKKKVEPFLFGFTICLGVVLGLFLNVKLISMYISVTAAILCYNLIYKYFERFIFSLLGVIDRARQHDQPRRQTV